MEDCLQYQKQPKIDLDHSVVNEALNPMSCNDNEIDCLTPSSLSSFSASDFVQTPHCVNLREFSLTSLQGYKSIEVWNSNPNHLYIGRDMTRHIGGALGSKWGNPYKADKTNRNSLKECLEKYEYHIRNNPDLFNALIELEGKVLGCWCKPSPCHGDILIKLFKERYKTKP